MIVVSPKLALYGAAAAAACIIAFAVQQRIKHQARNDTSLRVAREVLQYERDVVTITSRIDMRVNLETTQTARRAEDADHEIETIRATRADAVPNPDADCDDACARIVQLAWEARTAAAESSARLQPARAGTR